MKTKSISLTLFAFVAILQAGEPANLAIDHARFAQLASELEPIRERNRLSEEAFLKMSAEPGIVILDSRSAAEFAANHIKSARHLSLVDFTDEALQNVIPHKSTKVLIYCNNNIIGLRQKRAAAALNHQVFINLHVYGYTNVYELGPMLDLQTTKIPFEGTGVLPMCGRKP